MRDLAEILENANNLLFVGVGNVLKKDDGAGVAISRQIIERPHIRALTVEVSIENYIGKINSMDPEQMVILDCMELGSEPGNTRLIEIDQVEDNTYNTHNISLGRLGEFFKFPTYVLGIQPGNISFGEGLTPAVQESVNRIVKQINT